MSKKKLLIGLGVTLLVLIAIVVIFSIPSSATAQGLIEYATCGFDPGVPLIYDTYPKYQLEAAFGLEDWQDDWGFVYLCSVKFDKKTNIFNKLTMCITAYEDADLTGNFSFGDKKLADYCENLKE